MSTPTYLVVCRRDWLRAIVRDRFDGNHAWFARAVGLPLAYVHQLLTTGVRSVGEGVARKLERVLGLEMRALDVAWHEGMDTPAIPKKLIEESASRPRRRRSASDQSSRVRAAPVEQ
jgi:hypothetical protein